MSVYRFKSRETGDLVMLSQHGKRMLEILGKDPQGPGIVLPEQMPAAIDAIRAAIQADEALQKRLKEEAEARGDLPPDFDHVSLRMRSAPFIEMLQRCQKAGVEMVWGV
ncbi:DUF1840 domain-containing protein [Hydrogenophaga sp.]|uniref:DUF1840 domain-containing protein n=1 Tax=Hydrogenophaga sp. TaxID=1904254 RepID=UPI000ECCA854|nr:MAG: DUF1840 domain-containing protein [Comamonadaceae bacterium]